MEDILSSIRRIISEDGEEENEEKAESEADESAAEDDVLELTKMVDDEGNVVELSEASAQEETPPQEAEEAPSQEAEAEEAVAEEEPAGQDDTDAIPAASEEPAGDAGEKLISDDAEAEASNALASLSRAAAPGAADESALRAVAGGHTIEEHVLIMLRPLLREWLDKNLPALVQRLVEKEIERLVRRADPM
jgi:cell pole-organizing protein PopZ